MERTIYNVMSADPKKIGDFMAACDALANSQYILADAKISGLLQSIAASRTVYDLFGQILAGFNYKEEAVKFSNTGRLPEQPRLRAALVFCTLLDLDKKTILLSDFLTHSFNYDLNTAFESFLEKMVRPFKLAVAYLLSPLENKPVFNEISQTDKPQTDGPLAHKFASEEVNHAKTIAVLQKRIQFDGVLDGKQKKEILYLFDCYESSVSNADQKAAQKHYLKLYKLFKALLPALLSELEKLQPEAFIKELLTNE